VAILTLALAATACAPAYARSAADKREMRVFARSHHGYKVLGVYYNLGAPDGWNAVYWLKPGGPGGTYSAGGAAYFYKGRLKRHAKDVATALHPIPLYQLIGTGTGRYVSTNYTQDETGRQGDDVGVDFTLNERLGVAKPLSRAFVLDPYNETSASPVGNGLTGTGTNHYSDANDAYTCSFPMSGGGSFTSDPTNKGRTFKFEEDLAGSSPTSDQGAHCETTLSDPKTDDNSITLRASYSFDPNKAPSEFRNPLSYWTPFSTGARLDDHAHHEEAENGNAPATYYDEEIKVDETWTFSLVGLRG